MELTSIQDILEEACLANSDIEIIAYPAGQQSQTVISCRELLVKAKQNSRAIRSLPTWHPGSAVMIHISDQLNAIIWFWSVLYAGNIPAMSTALSNNTTQRLDFLRHMSVLLKQPICLTSEHEQEQFDGQEYLTAIAIESLDNVSCTEHDNYGHVPPQFVQSPALLMLTSGSTSNAKAVCLSHKQLLAAVRGKASVVDLPKGSAFMNWIAMDHVASLVEIHLQALYLGMSQVHVADIDVLTSPVYFLELVDRHRVSRTFAPNFFLVKLKAVLKQVTTQKRWDLSCLRCIASGGEANSTDVCVSVTKLLETYQAPRNVIMPGFGMTETCAGSIFNTECPQYDVDNRLEFLSLGHCMPGIEMRIATASQFESMGITGDLEVRGAVVFEEYYNDLEATAAAFTPDGWFRTGDQGTINASGHLYLTGRTKDIIIVNGVKYSPVEIETAVNDAEIPGVTPGFTVTFSSWSPQLVIEEIYVLYLPSYPMEDDVSRLTVWKAISKEVMLLTGARPVVIPVDQTVLQKSSLGKLSRGKLKTAFDRGELREFVDSNSKRISSIKAKNRQDPMNGDEEIVLCIFVDILQVSLEDFDVETPFFDAGITSIQLIQLKQKVKQGLRLESEIPITTLISNSTVRALVAELRESASAIDYEPVMTLQPEGDKTPLWLIHPGVGEVLVFIGLAKYITQRKVYALRARGFNAGESYFENIDEAVTVYHKSVKQKQPVGPYAVAGYSYGTMLAFEVAKRLEKHGDTVSFMGSFNLPPHIRTRMRQLDWNACIMHLSYFLHLFDEQHGRQLIDEARLYNNAPDQVLGRVLREADQDRLAALALTPQGLSNWASLAYSLQKMASDYEPEGSVESIDVFYCTPLAIVATSREEWRDHHLSKWTDFSRSRPRFHEVRGEHYTMLDSDNVFTFQQTLNKALKARGL